MYLAYQYIEMPIFILTLIFLLLITGTDLKSCKIYDKHLLIVLAIRLAMIPFNDLGIGWEQIIGLVVGFFVWFVPAMAINKNMGGDIKAYAILGLLLGWKVLIPHLVLTLILGLVFSGLRLKFKVKDFPLAPMFLVAFNVIMLMGLLGLPCPMGELIKLI